jgi:DNA-binding winged helix-turn-helix (wHTH) protein
MGRTEKHLYEFGEFRLDSAEHLLLRKGVPVSLAPKAFDLLLIFVKHSGHLIHKEELLNELWPDSFVEESNLTFNVSALRKALGDRRGGVRYIETVPKKGYRFAADVTELAPEEDELVIEHHLRARIVTEEVEGTMAEVVQNSEPGRAELMITEERIVTPYKRAPQTKRPGCGSCGNRCDCGRRVLLFAFRHLARQ